MRYTYKCECGYRKSVQRSMKDGPPSQVMCVCKATMDRDWQNDAPLLDTSACRDHSDVAPEHRTASAWDRGSPQKVEHDFQQHIHNRRSELRDGNRGSIRHKMSVPAHLFHGKIKETGDKQYWDDPKNIARHKDCEVG